jgi:uncharacterized protein (TIGR03437 family)
LAVTPSHASTPTSLSVSVNPAALPAGSYNGSITLTTGGGVIEAIPVSLTVGTVATFTAAPSTLSFSSEAGNGTPDAQTITVTNGSKLMAFSAVASGGNWLSVIPASGSTPASLRVFVNPEGLTPGNYLGAVTITPSGGQSPILVPVSYNLIAPVTLSASPSALSFSFQTGGALPGALSATVSSSGSPVGFNSVATTTTGGPWLGVSPAAATTPAAVTLTANAAGLVPGTYTGVVKFTRTSGGNSFSLPVTLTVAPMPALVNGTSALAFAFETGGSAPATRSISIGSSAAVFTVSAAALTDVGGPWLTVTPSTAATPANLIVSVDPTGLTPNTYTGSVSLSAPGVLNGLGSIPVVLLVSSTPAVAASPSAITFSAWLGAASPPVQQIDLASTGSPTAVNASVTGGSEASWLSISPSSGTAPGTLTVTANSSGLALGSYTGSVTLAYAGGGSMVIPVTLNVTNPPVAAPLIQAVTDAASFQSGSFAPMSIVTIWGSGLGPAQATPLRFNSAGSIDTTLAQTQVLFNGIPAPLLMVQANQINAIVPGAITGTAQVQVVNQGVTSSAAALQLAASAPYLFTANASGKGQGAILNQNTSANSEANPAAKGSIVVLFGDGAGALNPSEADGAITPSALDKIPKIVQPVSVQIGGIAAEVIYSGPAPGEVAGLMQINVRIPAGVASGAAPVVVKVGNASSQSGVTVAVQ